MPSPTYTAGWQTYQVTAPSQSRVLNGDVRDSGDTSDGAHLSQCLIMTFATAGELQRRDINSAGYIQPLTNGQVSQSDLTHPISAAAVYWRCVSIDSVRWLAVFILCIPTSCADCHTVNAMRHNLSTVPAIWLLQRAAACSLACSVHRCIDREGVSFHLLLYVLIVN